ncbi:DUF4199 domain-containing protein [Aquimarina sp. Aq107]|uniref:DUF4199 domain-containing protein n=1 Tax=Aquimarina sp. Aq107 TaxID=1191912 RepID=UPI000D557AAC|nr:DUF4199 domain-containing protein [Aquimarina sp. Aq107]
MESKSIPIKKYILTYGLLFGIASIILSFTFYLTGNYVKQNLLHSAILFSITVFFIIFGLLVFKKNNNGFISLIEALKIGIGIAILGGLMAVLWKIILLKQIDPNIINQFEDKQIKRIAEMSSDLTQKNIEEKIKITKKYTSPLRMTITALIEDTFVGFLLSLIGGLIIRKKRNPFK